MEDRNAEHLLAGFQGSLKHLPNVQVNSSLGWINYTKPQLPGHRVFGIEANGEAADLIVQPKMNAYPRDVRTMIDRFNELPERRNPRSVFEPHRLFVLIAPMITESSRKLLRDAGVGYWDQSESLYLPLPNALIVIDRQLPEGKPRTIKNLFHGRTAQVLHAMLVDPTRQWHIQDLAALAKASPATVHRVFDELEKRDWVKKLGKGPAAVRTLEKPSALLDAWKDQYALDHYGFMRFYRWTRQDIQGQIREATGVFERAGIDYALTLSAGASFVAPFVSSIHAVSLIALASPGITELLRQSGYSEVDQGESLLILAPRDESPLLFRQQVNDFWIASNIQLYLDLNAWPQRGKEQAEHLRHERIGF